jgi:Domain of unknown function (DUF4034)
MSRVGIRALRALLVMVCLVAARVEWAQLIPLLPPGMPDSAEDQPTPQMSRAAQEIQGYLVAEQFDKLDQMADRYRRMRLRAQGGEWKLRQFYATLDRPQATDAEAEAYLVHFEHWMTAKPNSITAPVAMAASLQRWAWAARGSGYVNTVTPQGWKLFGERMDRADKLLEGAAKLEPMCPEWYSEMLTVGVAKAWDAKRMLDLFEEGTRFEPGYFYLYKQRAYYLLPKWYGKPGESASFAKSSADGVGGDAGDILYFEIATNLIRRGDGDFPVKQMDWARIQHGEVTLEAQYGVSKRVTNELAYIAYKFGDATTAQRLFTQIGEQWATGVWRDKAFYNQTRQWAMGKALKDIQATN